MVFRWPGDRSQIWVKRVIGLPGDRVSLRAGRVSINGHAEALNCPAGIGQAEDEDGSLMPAGRFIETLPGIVSTPSSNSPPTIHSTISPETVVPPDHLFVMGDNRDNSADSRVALTAGGVGMLPMDDLVGRVEGVVGSWDLGMSSQPVWTWPSGLRLSRFFTAVD